MGKRRTLVPPIQPHREDRLFLRRADKPPLKPTPITEAIDEDGEPFTIRLEEHPIAKVIPRAPVPDINFNTLQVWLDHLGPAIYNALPILQTPDGMWHSSRNGNHRSRCLWEIGEPNIRLIVRHAATTELEGIKKSAWHRWLRKYEPVNSHPPATPYMFGLPKHLWKLHQRRYYPPLWKPSPVLQEYFNEPHNDGQFFRDTLFNDASFRDIYSMWPRASYRLDVVDAIKREVDVPGKSVLDVGAFYGWACFMLLEEEAKEATAVEHKAHRCQVMRHIALTRDVQLTVVHNRIQDCYQTVEKHDVCLVLNVFHHILNQCPDAWKILACLLDKCGVMFLMMGPKPNWGILKEYDNNVEDALNDNLEATVTPLFTSTYRNRVLFRIDP